MLCILIANGRFLLLHVYHASSGRYSCILNAFKRAEWTEVRSKESSKHSLLASRSRHIHQVKPIRISHINILLQFTIIILCTQPTTHTQVI